MAEEELSVGGKNLFESAIIDLYNQYKIVRVNDVSQ
jgi:hypothetical protein